MLVGLKPGSPQVREAFMILFDLDLQIILDDHALDGVPGNNARNQYYFLLSQHPGWRQGAKGHFKAGDHYRHAIMCAFPYGPKGASTDNMPTSHHEAWAASPTPDKATVESIMDVLNAHWPTAV